MAFRHDADLDFTDLFCGAGGVSTGLVEAGYILRLAANHDPVSIRTHTANHPLAEHLCADINNTDKRRLPRTRVLWGSPICTEIAPAGGRRRTRGQVALDLNAKGPPPAPPECVRSITPPCPRHGPSRARCGGRATGAASRTGVAGGMRPRNCAAPHRAMRRRGAGSKPRRRPAPRR